MSNQEISKPLVTVCLVTYNSSEFIIEALDSVFEQTYQNIELIVSDDCSKDNTVEVCKKWMSDHANRFIHAEVDTVEMNTGVSANCNRGIRKGTGEFIKLFAGDDKLLPNCIEDNVSYMLEHKDADLLFSDMIEFGRGIKDRRNSRKVFFERLTRKQFKTHLLVRNFLTAPSAFYSRSLYDKIGGFDESIPMMEDKPFYIKCVFEGCKFAYQSVPTVAYRIGDQSVSQTVKNNRFEDSKRILFQRVLDRLYVEDKLFWFYRRNEYYARYYPSLKHTMLRGLRFINPAYYYMQYVFLKIRLLLHFKND